MNKVNFIGGFPFKILPILIVIGVLSTSFEVNGADHRGRLGVGMTNQLTNEMPAISFKLQKSRAWAAGGLLSVNTDSDDGGYAAGLKVYRYLFDEPQLSFFTSLLGAFIKDRTAGNENTGFQFDLTLGTEFHFMGLHSLGISFEFGVSLNKIDDFIIETVGYNFIAAGVHFYL